MINTSLLIGLIFWFIFSLLFIFYFSDEDSLFGHVNPLPNLCKAINRNTKIFNIFGKIFCYVICFIVTAPFILLNYLLIVPVIYIFWGILNLFFWLATLKLKKDKTTKWTSTDKTE